MILARLYGQFDFYWNGQLVAKAIPLTEANYLFNLMIGKFIRIQSLYD